MVLPASLQKTLSVFHRKALLVRYLFSGAVGVVGLYIVLWVLPGSRDSYEIPAHWIVALASIAGIDIQQAAQKYAAGCPACSGTPCACSSKR